MKERIAGLAHCLHLNMHWEYCHDYAGRVEYIKKNKPKEEQKLHLRLFRIVPDDKLPGKDSPEWEAHVKAREAYVKAWEVYDNLREPCVREREVNAREVYFNAWEAYVRGREAYYNAWKVYLSKHQVELDKLHGELFPDCPWDGETIFTRKEVKANNDL